MNLFKAAGKILTDLWTYRKVLCLVAYKEFKASYFGSVFGIFWLVVEPAIYTAILFVVFGMSLKPGSASLDVHFVPWLITGMFLWNFTAASLQNSLPIFKNYTFLVRTPDFPTSSIPFIGVFSSLFLHLIFLLVLISVLIIDSGFFEIHWAWVFYYLFSTLAFVSGLSLAFSTLSVFSRDVKNLVSILVQFGFWFSPIFWRIDQLPEFVRGIAQANPMYFLIQGYRFAFLGDQSGIYSIETHALFWTFVITIFLVASFIFGRLNSYFGDEL